MVIATLWLACGEEPASFGPPRAVGPHVPFPVEKWVYSRHILPETGPSEPDPGSLAVTRVAVGDSSRCLVTSDGAVRCWDWHAWNALGKGEDRASLAPPVVGLERVVHVGLGYDHGCALSEDGTVSCWGFNATGAVGDGTRTSRSRPQRVPGLSDVRELAVGHGTSCARLGDATVRCWGDDWNGQLGQGGPDTMEPFEFRSVPVPVPALAGAVELALGAWFGCARQADGSVWCWGDNGMGQLGVETPGDIASTPIRVPTLEGVVEIAAGDNRACARREDGEVWCWGENRTFASGAPRRDPIRVPTRIDGFHGAVDLALGSHETCARMGDGSVRCAGSDLRRTPTVVRGVRGLVQLDANHGACGLDGDGAVHCWGSDPAPTVVRWAP